MECYREGISRSFFRGEEGVQFNPYKSDYSDKSFMQKFILKGWIPEEQFIDSSTKITAFGSCYVTNIIRLIKKLKFNLTNTKSQNIHISNIEGGLQNVCSILEQFEWALEDKKIDKDFWYGWGVDEYEVSEEVRINTRDIFLKTDVFFLTFGLSEIWEDVEAGETFWKAVPEDKYDSSKHRFRILSFLETKQKIEKIYKIIKKHIPNAKIIYMVSPTPMAATFREVSCITANSASKSILRASLDEFIRDNQSDVGNSTFYFPAYEMGFLFNEAFAPDNRHMRPEIDRFIQKVFEKLYCKTEYTWEELEDLFQLEKNRSIKIVEKKLV